jgi:uncharacterized protein YndB with AHSA1/START domain
MATIAVTPNQDALTGEIQRQAPPERVYKVLTDPAQLLTRVGTDRHISLRRGGD